MFFSIYVLFSLSFLLFVFSPDFFLYAILSLCLFPPWKCYSLLLLVFSHESFPISFLSSLFSPDGFLLFSSMSSFLLASPAVISAVSLSLISFVRVRYPWSALCSFLLLYADLMFNVIPWYLRPIFLANSFFEYTLPMKIFLMPFLNTPSFLKSPLLLNPPHILNESPPICPWIAPRIVFIALPIP